MRYLLFLFLTSLLLALGACDSSEKTFDRGLIVIQAADALILPTYQKLITKLEVVQQSLATFIDHPDVSSLEVLRKSHLEARLTWKEAEAFNFGPVDNLALGTQMDFWPVNVAGVEEEITNYDESKDYQSLLASNRKGLAAMEYLLFQGSTEEVVLQFEEVARQKMLSFYITDLLRIARVISTAWNEEGYYTMFISDTGQGASSGASLLANEMIMLCEQIKNKKLGEPLGLTSFEDPNPADVESYYAKESLQLIQTNLEIIQSVFNGSGGMGFDDYLNAVNANDGQESLSEVINNKLSTCLDLLSSIDTPLQETLVSKPDEAELLYEEIRMLIVLLKSDMMSQLGLTVIFGDSDGD